MNIGFYSGYSSGDINIIGTQYITTTQTNQAGSTVLGWSGKFHAPREATHALISACAKGGKATAGGADAAGGAGAACYRIVFELSVFRYIAYHLGHQMSNMNIGSSGYYGEYLTAHVGRSFGGFPGLILNDGADASGLNGGAGGSAFYYRKEANVQQTIITLTGGAGGTSVAGGEGQIISTPCGGILASGAGGGGHPGANYTAGGNVPSPWRGSKVGGLNDDGLALPGGGASLYCHGPGPGYNIPGWNLNSTNRFSAPGIGGIGTASQKSPGFIYCEFVIL